MSRTGYSTGRSRQPSAVSYQEKACYPERAYVSGCAKCADLSVAAGVARPNTPLRKTKWRLKADGFVRNLRTSFWILNQRGSRPPARQAGRLAWELLQL